MTQWPGTGRADDVVEPTAPVSRPTGTSPLLGRVWTDHDGTAWTRRGSQVRRSRVRGLLRRDDVRVVHVCGGDAVDVPAAERAALWQRAEPYLSDVAREPGDHTDFLVGEFRCATGASLLVVEERC